MITKGFAIVGAGLVGLLVHITTFLLTGSQHLAMLVTGICAFTFGIAAGKDGFWA